MTDDAARNVAAQVEMYGEPLAQIFGRLTERLGLTQGALARTLGMSPAMLSHLSSGTRVKIGNPAVQRRLEEVRMLSDAVAAGELTEGEVQERLDGIRESTGSWTLTRHDAPAGTPADRDEAEARTVSALLRAVSTQAQLAAAAELLEPQHAGLAQLLRTFGLGTPAEGADHLRRHRTLLDP